MLRFAFCCVAVVCSAAHAQLQFGGAGLPPAPGGANSASLTDPSFDATIQPLLDADRRFAADVLKGGGKAFAAWFADDAVTLSNGKAAVLGKAAITRDTTWKPDEYQLTWTPEGGRMGPSNDAGVTWGNYQGKSRDHQGNPIVTTGRYISVWRKQKDGQWKVLVDASNDAPPAAGDCCSIR